jgi:hypothetical protein
MVSIKKHMNKALLVTAALGMLATASAGTALAAGPAAGAEISVISTAGLTRHQPASAAALAPAGVTEVVNGTVRGKNVNLRTMPTIPSGIRGTFSSPMNLAVQCWAPYAYGHNWYRVKITGWGAPTGYMAQDLVNFGGSTTKCAGF